MCSRDPPSNLHPSNRWSLSNAGAQQASSETQIWEPPQSKLNFPLSPKEELFTGEKTSLSTKFPSEITKTSLNDNTLHSVYIAHHYYPLVIFIQKKQASVFFPLESYLNNSVHFSLLRCWSSSRGKSVSTGPKQRKRKQEGLDTLQHQPSSTINISLQAQILSPSGRRECDFPELNTACDSVGRWQLDTIIISSENMLSTMPSKGQNSFCYCYQ